MAAALAVKRRVVCAVDAIHAAFATYAINAIYAIYAAYRCAHDTGDALQSPDYA